VDEDVRVTAVLCDEAEALLAVEPLHLAGRHVSSSSPSSWPRTGQRIRPAEQCGGPDTRCVSPG
jgi:hypothetical protein